MKTTIKNSGFAAVLTMVATNAFAAGINVGGICGLVVEMQKVFKLLKILAFVGAAFTIAGWAWGYISKGDFKMDGLKDKGTSMLVGFFLLFGIGLILSFITSTAGGEMMGCPSLASGW